MKKKSPGGIIHSSDAVKKLLASRSECEVDTSVSGFQTRNGDFLGRLHEFSVGECALKLRHDEINDFDCRATFEVSELAHVHLETGV